MAISASIKAGSALRCSKEQQELAAERAAVKGERADLDRMRNEFEAELQQARGEMQRAQDALQGGQQWGAPPAGCGGSSPSGVDMLPQAGGGMQDDKSTRLILHLSLGAMLVPH